MLANSGNTYIVDDAMTNPGDTITAASATDNNGANISSDTSVLLQNTTPTVDSFTITPGASVERTKLYSKYIFRHRQSRTDSGRASGTMHKDFCWAAVIFAIK